VTPQRLASREAQRVVQEKTLARPAYSRRVLPPEYALPFPGVPPTASRAEFMITKDSVLQAVPNPSRSLECHRYGSQWGP